MKALFLFQFILFAFLSFGQKILVITNSSFLNGHVDSIKISYGKSVELTKSANEEKCYFILNKIPLDSLIISPDNYVSIHISGLERFKGDTILITNYNLFKYCVNDTIVYTHEKKKVFSPHYKKHSTTKIIPCDKPNQVLSYNNFVNINNETYHASCIIRTDYAYEIACGKYDSYTIKKTNSSAFYSIKMK